jgi:hypothetical protein
LPIESVGAAPVDAQLTNIPKFEPDIPLIVQIPVVVLLHEPTSVNGALDPPDPRAISTCC